MNKLAYLAISSSLLGFSSAFVQAPVAVNVRTVAPVAPQYAPTQDGAPVPQGGALVPRYAPAGVAPIAPQYAPTQGGAPVPQGGAPVPHYALAGVAPGAPHYAPTQGGAPAPDPRGVRAPRTQAVDLGSANAPRLNPRVAPAPRR